jgi:hypothetical protein
MLAFQMRSRFQMTVEDEGPDRRMRNCYNQVWRHGTQPMNIQCEVTAIENNWRTNMTTVRSTERCCYSSWKNWEDRKQLGADHRRAEKTKAGGDAGER